MTESMRPDGPTRVLVVLERPVRVELVTLTHYFRADIGSSI
jgi:hypothetical protein